MSGEGCLTQFASQLVHDYLQPHILSFTSYAQDTIDLLKVLDGICIPRDLWLVMIDVDALYNSIPHKRGVGVVGGLISQRDTLAEQ